MTDPLTPLPEKNRPSIAAHFQRRRSENRLRRGEDKTVVFRMMVAAMALLGGLLWPFFHQYMEAIARLERAKIRSTLADTTSRAFRAAERGVDWHSIGFWSFCLLIFLAAMSPEIKGFLGNVVDAIKAWKQQKQGGT